MDPHTPGTMYGCFSSLSTGKIEQLHKRSLPISILFLPFNSYALYHVLRKSLSNVKSVMQVALSSSNHTKYPNLYPYHIWDSKHFFSTQVCVSITCIKVNNTSISLQDEAELFFGYIDSTLLFCYAIGLYLSGWIADRCTSIK